MISHNDRHCHRDKTKMSQSQSRGGLFEVLLNRAQDRDQACREVVWDSEEGTIKPEAWVRATPDLERGQHNYPHLMELWEALEKESHVQCPDAFLGVWRSEVAHSRGAVQSLEPRRGMSFCGRSSPDGCRSQEALRTP